MPKRNLLAAGSFCIEKSCVVLVIAAASWITMVGFPVPGSNDDQACLRQLQSGKFCVPLRICQVKFIFTSQSIPRLRLTSFEHSQNCCYPLKDTVSWHFFFIFIYLFINDSIYFRDQLYSSLLFIRSAMKSMKQEMNLYVKINKQKCCLIVSDLKYFSDLYQNDIFGVLFYRHFVVRDMWPLVAFDVQTYLQSCIQIFHEST